MYKLRPWWRGVAVIVPAVGEEDRGFESVKILRSLSIVMWCIQDLLLCYSKKNKGQAWIAPNDVPTYVYT
jgi:hypothetical protein